MKNRVGKLAIVSSIAMLAFASLAQAQQEDGVIRSCLSKGKTTQVCICASLVLHARLGDQQYARFGEIEDLLADSDAAGDDPAHMALLAEGYRFFVPHGQAINACAEKIAAGE